MRAHPPVNYPSAGWYTVRALLSTPVGSVDVGIVLLTKAKATHGYISIWAYRAKRLESCSCAVEVTTDFRLLIYARSDTYEVSDLSIVSHAMPKTGDLVRCKSGSFVCHMSMFRVPSRHYLCAHEREVKSLVFNASYCPPTNPKFANAI